MNIVICEDDIQFCNYIKSILEKYIVNNHFNSKIVLTTSNPDNVINYIHNNSEITIYYLDIKLQNNKSGFDIASIIRENDYMSPIIFITNYEEMMSLTYEYKLEALDFIIKNNLASLRQRICENLKYIETRQQKGYMKCLNIKNKQKNFFFFFYKICYIESIKSTHKLILYYDNGMITFYALLKDIEKELDSRFIRCHKSIIVNKNKIVNIDKKKHTIELSHNYHCIYSPRCKEIIK